MDSTTSGWADKFGVFVESPAGTVQAALESFVDGSSPEQIGAWRESIQLMQKSVGEVIDKHDAARSWGVVFEYCLPYEGRRIDVLPLGRAVLVVEFKSSRKVTHAALDQVSAYSRDLSAYHRDCHNREVIPILVPAGSRHLKQEHEDVLVVSPEKLSATIEEYAQLGDDDLSLESFLDYQAYCPQPTLVEGAREIFESRKIREMWRARAETDPAVERISEIAQEAAQKKNRHLILIKGVPGAGKTLVGMRAACARYLDELAVPREGSKTTVPGLYLTGNGPLSEILQYELRKSGAREKVFVRHILRYLDYYVPYPDRVPKEHLLVFDEAQRAFSADTVADKHRNWGPELIASEPELFIRVCDRMPEWSVLIGLIGEGQEIHIGEEGGLLPWLEAIENSPNEWNLHAPEELQDVFSESRISVDWDSKLNLNTEIRNHRVAGIHEFVERVLGDGDNRSGDADGASLVADEICAPNGLRLYVTRDLAKAKSYLHQRYANSPNARYGIIASSRDKTLPQFGVRNGFMDVKNTKLGPWFANGEEDPNSCRCLEKTLTEFKVQGLELDMALLAWGTDFIRKNGQWTNLKATGYAKGKGPRDPFQLRLNSYRVLLTRGRDGTVIYAPADVQLNETWEYLISSGFRSLDTEEVDLSLLNPPI